MSILLRSMLVLGVASLLVVGCGKKEEAAPVEAAPAPVVAPAPAPAPTPEPGGYVPTPEERVPGITLDPAAVDAAAPADPAPVAVEPAPAATPEAKK